MATPTITPSPFPAPSKSASEIISNTLTTATSMSFSDKLLITITSSSSSGKLAHWIHVPLSSSSGFDPGSISSVRTAESPGGELLPRSDLTATTVLGGTKREDEVVGQTLATTLASAVLMKRPGEERLLVLGLGLQGVAGVGDGRDWFESVIGLCLQVL